MAKRPSLTSVRSKQNAVLRYVVSTDVNRTAKDLGVSTQQLKNFLAAKPETVKKSDKYGKILRSDPQTVAKKEDVKLVQRLSGKRLGKAYNRYGEDERLTRAIRYAQVTRQRRKVVSEGKVKYVPIDTDKGKIARKQILNNMSGESAKSIMDQYQKGIMTEDETKDKLNRLWKNSGVSGANEYFKDHS